MKFGSVIKNVTGTGIAGIGNHTGEPDNIEISIDGEICGIKEGGNAINLNQSDGLNCYIGSNADIHDNTVWAGAIYAQGKGITIDLYGKIRDNTSSQYTAGIWMANNFSGCGTKMTMHPGAKITGNISNTGEAAALIVSEGTFTMEGGTISENYSRSGIAGGVCVRRNGTFIMNGGEITDNVTTGNGGGIRYNDDSRDNECLILNGGTISGNIANATATQGSDGSYSFSGGNSNDLSIATSKFGHITRYVTIGDDVTIGNENIYFEKYGFTMERP